MEPSVARMDRVPRREAPRQEPDDFLALIAEHDRRLRGLAFRLLGDRDAMDDVLQEAYLKAYRSFPAFREASSVGTWLYRITYNACIDELRRRPRAEHVLLEDVATKASVQPDPSTVAATRGDLASALASLAPQKRASVLLVDGDGLTHAEAATVLGVPAGTVGRWLHEARATLRDTLGATEEGSA